MIILDYNSRLALAQIKGGHFNMSQLRDFIGVTERDRAAIGCYVTLDPITSKSARTAIVASGKIKIEAHTYQNRVYYCERLVKTAYKSHK